MLRINQLIIIAGPSCAGKTFLIKKIRKGSFPDLREKIGITTPSLWHYFSALDLIKLRKPLMERLVLHYDIYARYTDKQGFDHLSELIKNSDSVIILTLYSPPEIFINRINLRFSKTLKSLLSLDLYKGAGLLQSLWDFMAKLGKRLWHFRAQFRKRKAYSGGYSTYLYKKWFLFIDQHSEVTHWILDSGKPNITITDLYEKDSCETAEGVYVGNRD
jgi:hypothetical protein